MKRAAVYITVALITCSLACASARIVGMDQRQLYEADSLFAAESFALARQAYTKALSTYPRTPLAEHAQYMLGFLQLHHKNMFGDRDIAVKEFKKYQSEYPNGKRIEEVNTWLEMLHSIRSFEEGYNASIARVGQLENKQSLDVKNTQMLANAIVKCSNTRDSLTEEIRVLNREIEKLKEFILKIQ